MIECTFTLLKSNQPYLNCVMTGASVQECESKMEDYLDRLNTMFPRQLYAVAMDYSVREIDSPDIG